MHRGSHMGLLTAPSSSLRGSRLLWGLLVPTSQLAGASTAPPTSVEPGRFEHGKDPTLQLEVVFLDSTCYQGDMLPGRLHAPAPMPVHYKSPTNI